MSAMTAVVIDDEKQIRKLLRVTLESEGYRVHEAEDGERGLAEIAFARPEIVVLDLGLPGISGIETLRRLREWSEVPVVILSVRNEEGDKVEALDAGADDYVMKPFGAEELLARLRAARRRARPVEGAQVISLDGLVLDLVARTVHRDGVEIRLTATEYALLRLLARNAGRILTHRQILREVWGPKAEEHRQYLRVYVAHLRQKIERNPGEPRWLTTEPGIGYRFVSGGEFPTTRKAVG